MVSIPLTKVVVPTGGFYEVSIPYCGGGLTVPSNSRRVLGVDPYGAGVSIPPGHGFRSLMSRVRTLGGVDPAESWVSIPDE